MTNSEIDQLYERLARLSDATKEKTGAGSSWTYTFPDGETRRYVLSGLKSHPQIEDAARNLLMWIWSAKDYLKEWAQVNGKSRRSVEEAINADADLPICGDLANLSKHAKLTNSRSGLFPYFGRVAFSVPKETVGSITFRASEVQASVADPSLVTVSLPVFDQTGNQIGDAFEYAERGLAALERIRQIIEN